MKLKRIFGYSAGILATICIGIVSGFFITNATGSWELPMTGEYTVLIPAQIQIDGLTDTITYTVGINGELHPYDNVKVEPTTSTIVFSKTTDPSATREVPITQAITKLKVNDNASALSESETKFDAVQSFEVSTTGTVDLSEVNLTAGRWTAAIDFTFKYSNNSQADYFPEFDAATGACGHFDYNKAEADGLTNIVIPEEINGAAVTNLKKSSSGTAFDTTTDFVQSIYVPDTITSLGDSSDRPFFYSSAKSIRLSNFITEIPECAFYKSKLEDISIPNSVVAIGSEAFADCVFLRDVTISDSVTSIADKAFWLCYELTDITIPNSVTTIGDYTFYGCSFLQNITIPKGVISIGNNVFSSCERLKGITVSTENTNYASVNGVLFTKDLKTIMAYPAGIATATYQIPDSVITIGNNSFYNCVNLTNLTFPTGVTTIENCAFWGCSELTNITIPGSVTTIKQSAFYGCSNLTAITIPTNVEVIGDSAFGSCLGLTNVTILNKATTIGNYIFDNCTSLADVTVPSVSFISNAFSNSPIETLRITDDTSVASISLPSTVKSLTMDNLLSTPAGMFWGNSTLESISLPKAITISERTFQEMPALKEVYLPEATTFGLCAFWHSTALIEIELPKATALVDAAFAGCTSLEYASAPLAETIEQNIFYQCSSLKEVVLSGAKSFGTNVFYGCEAMEYLDISSLETLTNLSFQNWQNLSCLDASSLTNPGYLAFMGCGLTELNLPNVETLTDGALYGVNLTDLYILNVTTIGAGSFNGSNIQNVYISAAQSSFSNSSSWGGNITTWHWGYTPPVMYSLMAMPMMFSINSYDSFNIAEETTVPPLQYMDVYFPSTDVELENPEYTTVYDYIPDAETTTAAAEPIVVTTAITTEIESTTEVPTVPEATTAQSTEPEQTIVTTLAVEPDICLDI